MTKPASILEKIDSIGHPAYDPDEDKHVHDARIRDRKTFDKAAAAADTLGDLLNGGNHDAVLAGIVDSLLRQHRHLQNNTIVVLLRALGEIGGLPEGQVSDARNAYAYRLCRLLRERFGDEIYWR